MLESGHEDRSSYYRVGKCPGIRRLVTCVLSPRMCGQSGLLDSEHGDRIWEVMMVMGWQLALNTREIFLPPIKMPPRAC